MAHWSENAREAVRAKRPLTPSSLGLGAALKVCDTISSDDRPWNSNASSVSSRVLLPHQMSIRLAHIPLPKYIWIGWVLSLLLFLCMDHPDTHLKWENHSGLSAPSFAIEPAACATLANTKNKERE